MTAFPRAAFAASRYRAARIAQDRRRTHRLATVALKKALIQRGALSAVWRDMMVLTRMIRAWSRGEFRSISFKSVVLGLGALIYFLSPVDAIPDMLFAIGFVDDVVVLTAVAASLRKDLDRFVVWEQRSLAISMPSVNVETTELASE